MSFINFPNRNAAGRLAQVLLDQIYEGIHIFRLGKDGTGGIFVAAAFAVVDGSVLLYQLSAVVFVREQQHGVGRLVDQEGDGRDTARQTPADIK